MTNPEVRLRDVPRIDRSAWVPATAVLAVAVGTGAAAAVGRPALAALGVLCILGPLVDLDSRLREVSG